MQRFKKRILSLCAAAATALSAVPLTGGFAEFFAAPVTASAASSGTWDNCSWTLDSSGKLTITGSGTIQPRWYNSSYDYYTSNYPVKSDVKSLSIGSGITGIATCDLYNVSSCVNHYTWYGFENCTNLKSVSLPSTLKTLPESCFSGCSQLTSINLPSGLSTIPNSCFQNCTLLTSVTLPDLCERIGEKAFQDSGLTSLTTKQYISGIGSAAFKNCTSLSSVTLAEGLDVIGDSVFFNCDNLKTVTVPASVTSVGNSVFGDCLQLESVKFLNKNTTLNTSSGSEKKLVYNRYYNSSYLYSGKIIGYAGSTAKTYATTCGYTFEEINENPTSGSCGADVNWSISDDFTTLTISGTGAMENYPRILDAPWACYNGKIIHVEIGEGVTSVGDYAFSCMAIRSVSLPYGLTRIGQYAFAITPSIKNVYIPETVTEIGSGAFGGLLGSGVSGINLPEGLTTLASSVLTGTNLRTVTVPASVTFIDKDALGSNSKLTDVYILNPECAFYADSTPIFNSKTDGVYTFNGTIHGYYNSTAQAFASKYGYKFEAINKDSCGEFLKWSYDASTRTLTISGYGGMYDFTSVTQPWAAYKNQIEKISLSPNMTRIGNFAFYGLSKIEDVTVPASVESVGNYAFGVCSALNSVTFLNGSTAISNTKATVCNSETYQTGSGYKQNYYGCIYGAYDSAVKQYANNCGYNFRPIDTTKCGENLSCSYDESTNTLTVTGTGGMYQFLTYLETPWSRYYYDIKKIVIGEGVTEIGQNAFMYTSALTEISLPSTLRTIGNSAFVDTALTSITLPEGLETIGGYAFEYADELTSLTIPGTVTSIGNYALSGAFSPLASAENVLTVCEGVTSIPAQFANGSNLKKVILPASVTEIDSGAFSYCYSLLEITVPNPACAVSDSETTLGVDTTTILGYEGSTAQDYANRYTRTFTPIKQTLTEAGVQVSLSKTSFAYTGSAVKVGSYLSVKLNGTPLVYGTDYTTSYANNKNVGYQTATVTVKGKGKYSGSITKKYTIYPKKQAKPALSMSGTALHVEWTEDSTALAYQIEYCQNSSFSSSDASYHTATYTGKTSVNLSKYPKPGETWYVRVRAFITNNGKTSGTKYGAWSDAASLKLASAITSVTLSKTEFNYTGSAIKVGSYLSVMDGETKLTYGTDYTTTYENNTNCGVETASVTVKGIGNYSGTFTKKFTIVPAKQAKPTLTAVSGGFKAEWTADSNAIGYELVYCKDSSFTGETLHSCVYTATSATLKKYPNTGEKWYVKVRAVISSDGTTSGTLYGTYSAVASITAG